MSNAGNCILLCKIVFAKYKSLVERRNRYSLNYQIKLKSEYFVLQSIGLFSIMACSRGIFAFTVLESKSFYCANKLDAIYRSVGLFGYEFFFSSKAASERSSTTTISIKWMKSLKRYNAFNIITLLLSLSNICTKKRRTLFIRAIFTNSLFKCKYKEKNRLRSVLQLCNIFNWILWKITI